MYSSENSGFDIKDIIVKILFLVFFVLILMWLYPKATDMKVIFDRVYNENIATMKDAAVDYYTTKRLPKNNGDTVEMSLQKMIDLKLIVPFVDKDGNSCDTANSYVKVTKEDSEYVMKVNLVCGNQSDYVVEYIGCHDVCEGKTCTTEKVVEKTSNNKPNTPTKPIITPTPVTKKYTVNIKVTNGTTSKSSIVVTKGKNASTTVKPKTGYEFGSVSCTNNQKGTWSSNNLKVTKVTANTTCTVKFVAQANKYLVKVAVVNGTSDVKVKEVTLNGTTNFNITANTGYTVSKNAVTCTDSVKGVMSGSKLILGSVKGDGACVVTLGKPEANTTKYTVNVQVVNGKSNVTSKTILKGGSDSFVITPNSGYGLNNATVSCGTGVTGSLLGSYLTVRNVQANANCVVILKSSTQYESVSKTYYSVGYTKSTGAMSYTINLNSLPANVRVSDIVATGVTIVPMSSYSDFSNYVAAKKQEEMTMLGGDNGYSVAYNTAATLQAHALKSTNFTVSAKSGCTTKVCQVIITENIKNFTGVTPTGQVTLVNGLKETGLYYVPVKMVVTFRYEK